MPKAKRVGASKGKGKDVTPMHHKSCTPTANKGRGISQKEAKK